MRISSQELIVMLGCFGVVMLLFSSLIAALLKVVKTTMKVLKDESERNRKDIEKLKKSLDKTIL